MNGILLALATLAMTTPDTFEWSGAAPSCERHEDADGWVRLVTHSNDWSTDFDHPGAPDLPRRTLLFALPDGTACAGVDVTADWQTLAESVRIRPVQAVTRDGETAAFTTPDAAAYGAELAPAEVVTADDPLDMGGVRVVPVTVTPYRWHPRTGLLEYAAALKVTFRTVAAPDMRSVALSEALAETARQSVVNPTAVATKRPRQSAALPSTTILTSTSSPLTSTSNLQPQPQLPRYLLISPPDFVEDWQWYVGERAKVHPDLVFEVKNTAEIYRDHPFGNGLACRNAAESLHAYIRNAVATNNVKYVVLGGAWLDAQNRYKRTTYFSTGELMTLSNSVPGVYGYPRENWREIPSDMFYACLDLVNGQKYPWDADEDGVYINQSNCPQNDIMPDVSVTRITLNPWSGTSTPHNRHALVTNYVDKLARGEAKSFRGHYRYGVSADSTGSRRNRANRDRMYYKELEFYDGMYNMFDPRHYFQIEDNEKATRERFHGQFSKWRPVKSVKGMFLFTWTQGFGSLAQAQNDYYASDMDYGFVYSHGWAQGATHFQASRFGSGTGLTLLNGSNGPCDTGYPDYYVTYNGKLTLSYNLGDSGVSNPKGGALCSINNTRWGWAGGSDGYNESMSYLMLNRSLVAFNEYGWNVGDAWLYATRYYAGYGGVRNGGTSTWTLTEQICYGDPLVQLPPVPNVWWTGDEQGGVWDLATANWTNNVDDAHTFDAANNVYFNVTNDMTLTIAGEIAAMRLSVPIHEDGRTFRLTGTDAGTLRVMSCLDIAGTNTTLALNVAGGIGHDGIQFLTGSGTVTFEGQHQFYLPKAKNASRINLNGGGVILDLDEFASDPLPLAFDGPGLDVMTRPNELRSLTIGRLNLFGPFHLTNTWVKLATRDAFGNDQPQTIGLVNSRLEIAANAGYELTGYPEGLNATFLVDGASVVTNSVGGLWTVKHTTTFRLSETANLQLAAETANGGGRIVLEGPGRTEIVRASALAGTVTVGPDVTLVLDQLPLVAVTSLTIADGAKVLLPDEKSGYWQVVPVSSKFICGSAVDFRLQSSPDAKLDGSPSLTGAFFREGALYRWTKSDGEWGKFIANRYPKMLFGEVDGNTATVRVTQTVSPEFAFFANAKTHYVFTPAADDAAIVFSSILFCGRTEFQVPVSATEYVVLSSGTSSFCRIIAPYVHVSSGAALALTGSHWTRFTLEDGAILKAVPGETLDCNRDTTFEFPASGTILLDVNELELTDSPTRLIGGAGRIWSTADLAHFALSRPDAELRLVDGALAVVLGDGLQGPYALAFAGETRWNTDAWTATTDNVPFLKVWNACTLDWTADLVLSATGAESATLHVDSDVHADTLSLTASPECESVTFAPCDGGRLSLATIDCTGCPCPVTFEAETGAADIIAPTNDTAVLTLCRSGTGTLRLSGSSVFLREPYDYTLAAGSQGSLRFVASQGHTPARVSKVANGFELGGLEIEATDRDGNTIPGFTFKVSNGELICTPPPVRAEVPPGTNEIRQLTWTDVFGNVVAPSELESTTSLMLVGTPTSGVVIAKNGFFPIWSRLAASNTVTLLGGETFTPPAMPSGPGTFVLTGGFTVNADLQKYPALLNNSRLGIGQGTTMRLTHGNSHFDASGQNWRGIVGTGRITFVDSTSSWISMPGDMFASTLEVVTASDIVLTQNITTQNPFGARNLSGAGTFRSDWGTGSNWRAVRTVQTGVSEWSGTLTAKSGSRDSCLIVGSDAQEATTNKALIISSKAVAEHTLEIEKNGCVILTGTWQGPVKVNGLLVITNEASRPANVTGSGEVRLVEPKDVPPVTGQSAYVPPTYPDDPDTPDEPSDPEPEPVRIVTACVATARTNFSELEWRDNADVVVTNLDWSAVTNATLAAAVPNAVVALDATAYAGELRLTGGVILELHAAAKFTLAAGSVGALAFRFASPPSTTVTLAPVAGDFGDDPSAVTVTVGDRYGRTLATPGSVEFDGARFYYYVQDLQHPTWSATFENSTRATLSYVPGWANDTYDAKNFTNSRSGRALLPMGSNPYINGTLPGANGCVTHHAVMRLPSEENKMLVCCGAPGNAYEVWFVSTGGDSISLRNSDRTLMTVAVPLATRQFHAYAAVMDSKTLKLYVDGNLAGTCAYGGIPSSGMQFFSVHGGGYGYGVPSSASAAIDDWRSYDYLLTETSIRALASEFAPWPEEPEVLVDCPDLYWDELDWPSDLGNNDICSLRGTGGSLVLTNLITVSQPLAVIGEPVPVKLTGDGELVVQAGLSIGTTSGLNIDASALDGTNCAKYAAVGMPYARWLVRGPFSGSVNVTKLPPVPNRYTVTVEQFAALGVRLVFSAPKFAIFDSIGLSIGPASDLVGATDTLGLHPTPATNWVAYSNWTTEATSVGGLTIRGGEDGAVDSQSPYGMNANVARFLWHTSFDGNGGSYDGHTNSLSISGITAHFNAYRIIVYLATDTDGAVFAPVLINGRVYCGAASGASAAATATVPDLTVNSWGRKSSTPCEGLNAVVSDVLTNDAVTVASVRQYAKYAARAQIAALQIVEVGRLAVSSAVDFNADVTGDTLWRDGRGDGLRPDGDWVNNPASTISLRPVAADATLVFDTAVTADVLTVTGEAGTRLRLVREADFVVGSLDVRQARGEVALTNLQTLTVNAGVGSHVRFDDAATVPRVVAAGASVSYRRASFAGRIADVNWILRLQEADDAVSFDGSYQFMPIDVTAGTLTYATTEIGETVYGGHAESRTNSVFEVRGGRVVCNVKGRDKANGTVGNRGFILGCTASSGTRNHVLSISGGEFDCSKGLIAPWEYGRVYLSGGTLKAHGIWRGGNNPGSFTMSGGVLRLGASGMGNRSGASAGGYPVTFAGGDVLAAETAAIELKPNVTGRVRTSAATGAALRFAHGVGGSGTLVCGDGGEGNDGEVCFPAGVDASLTMEGRFTLWLTTEQMTAEDEVVLFRVTEAFDRSQMTLLGTNGVVQLDGEFAVAGGKAVWRPNTAYVRVTADEAVVRLPRAWLRARSFDPAAVLLDPTIKGANKIGLAESYLLGLEPTNAHSDVHCDLTIDAGGRVTVQLPAVDPSRQPNAALVRYVLQSKTALEDEWKDHATSAEPSMTLEPDGVGSRFFRYLIRFTAP